MNECNMACQLNLKMPNGILSEGWWRGEELNLHGEACGCPLTSRSRSKSSPHNLIKWKATIVPQVYTADLLNFIEYLLPPRGSFFHIIGNFLPSEIVIGPTGGMNVHISPFSAFRQSMEKNKVQSVKWRIKRYRAVPRSLFFTLRIIRSR